MGDAQDVGHAENSEVVGGGSGPALKPQVSDGLSKIVDIGL